MSEPVFFEWIEIEGFRGFGMKQRLDLDASVVIVSGPNGTGKTSFFDAAQWLLVGSLERLEPWRVRRNTEHVVNKYRAEDGELARVSASVKINGERVELRRTGRYYGSQLEWQSSSQTLHEHEAEQALADALTPVGRISLQRSLLSSGLLQQDVIRDVLEDKPSERYDQLASILGLNSIAGFPDAAKARAEKLATDAAKARDRVATQEESLRHERERLNLLRDRITNAPSATVLRDNMTRRIAEFAPTVTSQKESPKTPEEARAVFGAAGSGANDISSLLRAANADRAALAAQDAVPEQRLTELQAAVDAIEKERASARDALEAANEAYEREREVSSRLSRLATEAIPLLSDECPVCGQPIDRDHVGAHLKEVSISGSPRLPELLTARDTRSEEVHALRESEQEASEALSRERNRATSISRAHVEQEQWRAQIADALARIKTTFDLGNEKQATSGDTAELERIGNALAGIARAAGDYLNALKELSGSSALALAQSQVAQSESKIRESREIAARASASEDEARILQRASVRASAVVTEERFAAIRPVLQDVYTRLDPHPTFTDIEFAVDVYREKGIANPEVKDPEREVSADPLLIFSSSQANVVALSAFVALGWASGEDAMPFLLLDDPLQSLDDVNALGFADLCRHMRTHRQLIVSTHDSRLASLMRRKLAPRKPDERSRHLEFVAWSRTGPVIDQADIPPQTGEAAQRTLLTAGKH